MFETKVFGSEGPAHCVVGRTFSQVGVLRRFKDQLKFLKWNHVFFNTYDYSPSQGLCSDYSHLRPFSCTNDIYTCIQ